VGNPSWACNRWALSRVILCEIRRLMQVRMTNQAQSAVDAAFEHLFREYQRPIYNYLCRLVGDRARAEELAQQVFVKAYQALPRLPADANFRAWLYRIATNAGVDHRRRRRLLQWLPLLERDAYTSGGQGLERRFTQHDAVQKALGQLSPADRAVLVLFGAEGYSTAEIGEMIGASQGAVKTRLCRARAKFRDAYGGED
jgi:RNA polymerase sigma-70 factor (ECF subfamily)